MRLAFISLAVLLSTVMAFAVPQLINYQGSLAAPDGTPLDTTVAMTFKLYADSAGGGVLWTETQPQIVVSNGLFGTMIGSFAPLTGGLFDTNHLWLGISIGNDAEASPRARLATAAYSFRVGSVNNAAGGTVTGDVRIVGRTNLGWGNVLGDSAFAMGVMDSATGPYATVLGGKNNAALDSFSVVAGGYGNVAGSDSAGALLDFGHAPYSSIGGGFFNRVSGPGGSVGGGYSNQVIGDYGTIGGGFGNIADGESSGIFSGCLNFTSVGNYAFIGGGCGNSAGGPGHDYASVVGGYSNEASGYAAAIGGGINNEISQGEGGAIAGGVDNMVSNDAATVSGGSGNSATGTASTVSGGGNNVASGASSAIGGGSNNTARGQYAVVCGGGGAFASDSNCALGNASAIVGGANNRARGIYSFVGGGGGSGTSDSNSAIGSRSVVVGGWNNVAYDDRCTIVGGSFNRCGETFSSDAFIGGGTLNNASGNSCTIGGGKDNHATGDYSTIPGGLSNEATGDYSFAAGLRAQADDPGCFVWGATNSATETTVSTLPYSFTARCANGARFLSTQTGTGVGVVMPAGGGMWNPICDSTKKRNIRDVDAVEILRKVKDLPLKRWSYRTQDPSIEHIGPMAQDFYALFRLGDSDTTISELDPAGIALAAIQELAKENSELRNELSELRSQFQTQIAGQLKALKEDK